MSCHRIGRGLNHVVDAVIDLYDEKELSRESAIRLIKAARKGVHWCDGNEEEAVESLYLNRCGCCLRKMQSGEEMYNLFDGLDRGYDIGWNIMDNDPEICTPCLCSDCFDKILEKHIPDCDPDEYKEKIRKNQSPRYYTVR